MGSLQDLVILMSNPNTLRDLLIILSVWASNINLEFSTTPKVFTGSHPFQFYVIYFIIAILTTSLSYTCLKTNKLI